MKHLRVTILDLTTQGPTTRLYPRVMNANYASIMPQVIAVWCEQSGHRVRYICFTGREDITGSLADETDLLIIGAFTRSALVAYAISAFYRKKGAITLLGGPHARCYPQDAAHYFDYVLGFTDKALIDQIMSDCVQHRPQGLQLEAPRQPVELPGVQERWNFIEETLVKAPTIKLIPMIGSMGCPYNCSFCIDSVVDYQPLAFDRIQDDLRFLLTRMKHPLVAWHDPNFGVRFKDYMDTIEVAIPPGRIRFIAESSLSLLSEDNLKRLNKNRFIGILPGIESWNEFGNKSKSGNRHGLEKVHQVADHINMILRYIPFVQTNFVLGLDCDSGTEPFELTKTFLDLVPGAFPAFSLFTCYGQAAPLNLELQRAGRVLPTPFHFLGNKTINIRPAHYDLLTFYDLMIDLTRYVYSKHVIYRRFMANRGMTIRLMNLFRAISSNRVVNLSKTRSLLGSDMEAQRYYNGESTVLPAFYRNKIQHDLGPLWESLPEGGMEHNQNAYLLSYETELRKHKSKQDEHHKNSQVSVLPNNI